MKNWFRFENVTDASAEIYLYGYVGEWPNDAMSFVTALKALPAGVSRIDLRIHSPGGSVIDGFAIYNALLRHPAKKVAYIDGWAASMASIILMVADEIHMPANTWVMIHNPWAGVAGDAEELRKYANVLEGMQEQAIDAYARHTAATREEIAGWMDAETWFPGSDFEQYGFDFVAEPDMAEVAAAFDPASRKTAPEKALSLFSTQTSNAEKIMFLKLIRDKMGKPEATEAEAVAFVETLKTPDAVLTATDAAYAQGKADADANAIAEAAKAADAKLAEAVASATAAATAHAAAMAAKETELANAKAEIKTLAEKHERLMGGMKPTSQKEPANLPRPALAAYSAKVASLITAEVNMDEANVKAQREFPDLFTAMIDESKTVRNAK